jgi:hypothetical protein
MAAAAEVCSPTKTIQEDSTCRFHTLSRMIIRSVFDPLLKMTPEESDKYKKCMPLVTPITQETLESYSIERCSEKGYIKIMLFYYFFELTKRLNSPTIMKTNFQELLAMPLLKPPVPGINEEVFDNLRGKISQNWVGFQIQLDDLDLLPEIQSNAIRPILNLGGYLALGLDILEKRKKKEIPEKHIVLVVGEDKDGVHIKNSWGTLMEIVKFTQVIKLNNGKFKTDTKPIDLFFMLEVPLKSTTFCWPSYTELYGLLASIPPQPENVVMDVLETAVSALSRTSPSPLEAHLSETAMDPPIEGGKKRKTKYGQRRNHHQSKTIRASRKRPKTRYTRRLSKH